MSERRFRRATRCTRIVGALGMASLIVGTAQAQSWKSVTSARQVWGTEPVDVHVEFGAGELRVQPGDRPMLYRMDMRYDEDRFTPVTTFDRDRQALHLGVRGREGRKGVKIREGSRATIWLTREVPLGLELEFGAGEAEIDLGGMRLRHLALSTGASETTVRFGSPNPIRAERVDIKSGAAELEVYNLGNTRAEQLHFQGGVGSTLLDFGGEWDRSARASVQMGIGSVKLRFPRGLGVRINKQSFLTSFDGEGLIKQGNSYFSRNWEDAPHKLTVDLDAALGSIEVEWIG